MKRQIRANSKPAPKRFFDDHVKHRGREPDGQGQAEREGRGTRRRRSLPPAGSKFAVAAMTRRVEDDPSAP